MFEDEFPPKLYFGGEEYRDPKPRLRAPPNAQKICHALFLALEGRLCTHWCIILRTNLMFARESRPDGEGKRARRRNKSATFFTHFLTQKIYTTEYCTVGLFPFSPLVQTLFSDLNFIKFLNILAWFLPAAKPSRSYRALIFSCRSSNNQLVISPEVSNLLTMSIVISPEVLNLLTMTSIPQKNRMFLIFKQQTKIGPMKPQILKNHPSNGRRRSITQVRNLFLSCVSSCL